MAKPSEILKNRIQSAMTASDVIHDITHVIVNVETTGMMAWKKTVVKISGRVNRKGEKEAIEKILETECADMAVENTLRVEER